MRKGRWAEGWGDRRSSTARQQIWNVWHVAPCVQNNIPSSAVFLFLFSHFLVYVHLWSHCEYGVILTLPRLCVPLTGRINWRNQPISDVRGAGLCFSLITWYADNVELYIPQNPDQFVVLPSHHLGERLQNQKRISWILWNIKLSIRLHWTIQKHLVDDEFKELFGMMKCAAQFGRQLWYIIHIMAVSEAYKVKRLNHFLFLTMEIVQWVVNNPARVTGWDWDLSELKDMFHLSEQQASTSKHILFTFRFGSTFMVELNTAYCGQGHQTMNMTM